MSAVLNQQRPRAGRTPRSPRRTPTLSPAQSRTLLRVGFRAPGVLIAIIATVVLVTLVSVNSDLTGTFGAIAGLWFAVHQVPLSIAGTALGVFPLLPTLVLGVVVARGVSRAVGEMSTRRECLWIFGAAVLGPLVVTVLALAVAADASAAIGLDSPRALFAFAWVGGVHAVSAGIGVAVGTWDFAEVIERMPTWVRLVVRPTVRAGAVLVAGGSAVVLAALVASWSTVGMLLDAGDGVVGALGLTVLSILYLPNIVVGALAVSVGSSAHVGDVAVSMFDTAGGPVPPLPVLAVLPEGAAQTLWLLMLIVPVTAGVFLGRDCARRTVDVHHALSSVWLGAGVIGVVAFVVGFASGGNLGTFGTVEVTVWSFGLLAFALLAVVGSVVAAITAWRGEQMETETEVETAPAPIAIAAPGSGTDDAVDDDTPVLGEPDGPDPEDLADPARSQSSEPVEAEIVEEPALAVDAGGVSPTTTDEQAPIEAEVVDAETTEDLPDKPSDTSD